MASDSRPQRAEPGELLLRDVVEADLPIFFEHQLDSEANRMAAFAPRERDAFMAHWSRILGDETVTTKTVLFDGAVAGNVVSFDQADKREIGYWIGKEFWGKGIATGALAEFLRRAQERPLYAHVAKHNLASIRVLEKCGFALCGENEDFSTVDGERVEAFVLELRV